MINRYAVLLTLLSLPLSVFAQLPYNANDINISLNEDQAKVFDVESAGGIDDLGNQHDSLWINKAPTQGVAFTDSLTIITYIPNPDFFGLDSIEFRIKDYSGQRDTAYIYLNIHAVNDKPVANLDTALTGLNTAVIINPEVNDTDKEGPLDINSLALVSLPLHGSANVQNNEVIYEPGSGYTGLDSFQYQICDLDVSPLCDTAWIRVRTTDNCTPAICVWPGDGNIDGIANNYDVFSVGLSFGQTGYIRTNASTSWFGQYSQDWPGISPEQLNVKSADSNGDGVIDADDIPAISDNYNFLHNKAGHQQHIEGIAPLSINIVQDSVKAGDTLEVEIMLGSSTDTMSDIYGYALTINYPNDLIDSSYIVTDYSGNWISSAAQAVHLEYVDHANGRYDIAYSRTDQMGINGYGKVGVAFMKVVNNIDGKVAVEELIKLEPVDERVINSQAQQIQVNTFSDSVIARSFGVGLPPANDHHNLLAVFPNPTQNVAYIATVSDKVFISSLNIMDITGRQMVQKNMEEARLVEISTSAFAPGIYMVEVTTNKGVMTRQLIIQ